MAEWLKWWTNLGVNTTIEWLGGRGLESHSRHEQDSFFYPGKEFQWFSLTENVSNQFYIQQDHLVANWEHCVLKHCLRYLSLILYLSYQEVPVVNCPCQQMNYNKEILKNILKEISVFVSIVRAESNLTERNNQPQYNEAVWSTWQVWDLPHLVSLDMLIQSNTFLVRLIEKNFLFGITTGGNHLYAYLNSLCSQFASIFYSYIHLSFASLVNVFSKDILFNSNAPQNLYITRKQLSTYQT